MPLSARNFSRPFKPESLAKVSVEQSPPIKSIDVVRPASTRNVLRKKPRKSSKHLLISAPYVGQTTQSSYEPLCPSGKSSTCRISASKEISASQVRRASRRRSGHAMPLASHPDTMSFAQAPSKVSLPAFSSIPCFNSYSITHRLKCGHIVCTPTYEECGKNCDSLSGHGFYRAAANEAFICQACIGDLLDAKYRQLDKKFTEKMCPTWPFQGTRVDGVVQKRKKVVEEAWEAERAKNERALVSLGRYSYALSYS